MTGSIEVGAAGPLSVTSSVGDCELPLAPPHRAWDRERTFVCGTDYRIRVLLGNAGAPPIGGTVSNQRTETLTTYGETTCRVYETTDTGERICIAWNMGQRTERRTTGSTARFLIVTDAAATRP